MKTFSTMFSGGEGFSVGAVAAGYSHLWGIEWDSAIADVARMNGFHVVTADVCHADPADYATPSHLHASPVCSRASTANTQAELNEDGTKEAAADMETAEAVCRFIRYHRPETFSLENVYGYRKFKAFQSILKCLSDLGYFYDYENVNTADFGVPQTRMRLVLRASRVGLLRPLEPTHDKNGANGLPNWIGWYEAIEDVIDSLPESKFADWQMECLPDLLGSVLIDGKGTGQEFGKGHRQGEEPAYTVVTDDRPAHLFKAFLVADQKGQLAQAEDPSDVIRAYDNGGAMPRAFIVDGQSNSELVGVTLRQSNAPINTLSSTTYKGMPRAFITNAQNGHGGAEPTVRQSSEPVSTVQADGHLKTFRAYLAEHGRVVQMTTRALARFQSFPDTYQLSASKKLACKVIGNAVPPRLAAAIMESFK